MSDDSPSNPLRDLDLPAFLDGEQIVLPEGDLWEFGRYFDRQGQPIDARWAKGFLVVEELRQDPACFLKSTFSWHGVMLTVHTSYLGLNHQYLYGPPLVWESIVSTDLTGWGDMVKRYTTEAAAYHGHKVIVETLVVAGLVLVEHH